MRVLIIGAGVIGSIFAELLYRAGNDVTLLARGRRLAELREHGIIAHNVLTGETSYCSIRLIEVLPADDEYDLILVAIPKIAMPSVLPLLAKNTKTRTILFMVNTANDYEEWARAVGKDRLLIGFPGAGGDFAGPVVRYALTPSWLQQTTIGELDGSDTERLIEIASVFRLAGIPASCCQNMHAWQLTHIALVVPLTGAIAMSGNVRLLPLRRDLLDLTIDAAREGVRVLEALQIPITPSRFKFVLRLPKWVLSRVLSRLCSTAVFVTVASHGWRAREALRLLAAEFRGLAARSGVPTPAMDRLTNRVSAPHKQATNSVAA